MDEPFIDENEDDEDDSGAVIEVRPRGRPKKNGKGESHEPVLNSEHLPLFPDYDRDNRHVIATLEIYKLTSPGDGFKGTIAPNSTLETIGRLFGNGRYDIHAVSSEGKILRRQKNVAISLGASSDGPRTAPNAPSDMRLLEFQAQQHERDAARSAALHTESSQQNRALTEKHLGMVEKMHDSQASRDREFFQAQQKMQSDFFTSILALTNQTFQQTIVMMEQSHQRALAQSDPRLYLSLFKSGLDLGRGLESEDDEENPIVRGLQVAVTGLREAKDIALLRSGRASPILGQTPAREAPLKPSVPPRVGKTPKQNPRAPEPSEDRAIIQKLLLLKKELEAKGIDLAHYLDGEIQYAQSLADESESEPSDSESGEEESSPNHDGKGDSLG